MAGGAARSGADARHRPACVTAMRGRRRAHGAISIIGLVMVAGCRGGDLVLSEDHADRLPAGGGPGRVLRDRAVAGRRLDRPHHRRRAAGRADPEEGPLPSGGLLGRSIGLNFPAGQLLAVERAFLIVSLKPFEDRTPRSETAPASYRRGSAWQVPEPFTADVSCRLQPPPIIGLGTGGGFELRRQETGGANPKICRACMRGCCAPPTRIRNCARVFSTFSASTPSIYLDIDRDKAQVLGCRSPTIFRRCRRRWAATM